MGHGISDVLVDASSVARPYVCVCVCVSLPCET